MFYFFSRGKQTLRCEVRPAIDGDGYEIVVTDHDGSERVEYHPTSDEVHRRWLQLHDQFSHDGWKGPVTQDGRG
jgi:hypothetical protein